MVDFSLAKMLEEAAGNTSSLDRIFEHEPVDLKTFINDKKYLGLTHFELSDPQTDLVRHIEQIYFPETIDLLAEHEVQKEKLVVGQYVTARLEPYWATRYRMTNKITAMWGKGGGKDSTVRVGTLRVIYLLMCLKSPQVYYEMPDVDSIHTLNIASSAPQALRAFFDPIRRAVKSGWFADKCEPTKNQIEFDKNIIAISGHSQAESQEGLNLILGVADEIDAFPSESATTKAASTKSNQGTAEYILNMMDSSASTRFPDIYKLIAISYPRYQGSPIMNAMAEARKDMEAVGGQENSTYYISGPYATWEVNPRVTGKDKFTTQYRKDPIEAAAKYECKPAKAMNPYFRNEQALMECFPPTDTEPIKVSYTHIGNTWQASYEFHPDFKPVEGAIYAMHGDLALTGDRAGIAMAHVKSWNEYEDIVTQEDGFEVTAREMRPEIKLDFVFSYESDIKAEPPREIQIRWARQLCFELIKRGFKIKRFTFDQFQCLSGDTEIPLLDGTTKTMKELEGSEPFWLYSINSEGHVVPGLCTKAWSTGYRDDMLEVELDNGEVIKATQDHRFMLRDGSYIPARDLTPGDSLMPLYRDTRKLSHHSQAYERVRHPEPTANGQHWRYTHSMVSHYSYGKLPKGWVTHHKNVNPRDNRPENLVQLTNEAHSAEHARMAREDGTSRFALKWQDAEWAEAHKARLSSRMTRIQEGRTGAETHRFRHEITFEAIDRASRDIVAEGKRLQWRDIAGLLRCSQGPLYARIKEAGFKNWTEYKWSIQPRSYGAEATAKSRQKKSDLALHNNHKVVAVRPASPEIVYDLQVEKYHNFATSAGVFVHNSADTMQILQAHGIESDRVSTDRTSEVWRNLRDVVHDGRLQGYYRKLVIDELLGLTQLSNGKVDHTMSGSKDEADALACAVVGAIYLGGEEADGAPITEYAPTEFDIADREDAPIGAFGGTPLGMSSDMVNW